MKNVLVVFTTGFVPYGGLTTVMMNYYRVLDKSEIHIDFACTNQPPQTLLDEISQFGSTYYRLPSRTKKMFSYYISLQSLCKKYEVIHVHGNSSTSLIELSAAKKAGIAHRIIHNHNSLTGHKIINAILHPFFVKSYTCAVACSEKAGDWLYGKGQFVVLRNAINVDRFIPKETERIKYRKQFNIDENDFVIGHVGKMVEQKNHKFLLDIFSQFHKMNPVSKLLLVGSGMLEQNIRIRSEQLGISDSIIFAGLRTDIPEMMSVMDVFLFPSLWEGLPLSALEAQASGLPIFVSDVISSEVIISENCYIKSLDDTPDSWARYIQEKANVSDRLSTVERNKESLTKAGYNIQTEADNLMKLYLSDLI